MCTAVCEYEVIISLNLSTAAPYFHACLTRIKYHLHEGRLQTPIVHGHWSTCWVSQMTTCHVHAVLPTKHAATHSQQHTFSAHGCVQSVPVTVNRDSLTHRPQNISTRISSKINFTKYATHVKKSLKNYAYLIRYSKVLTVNFLP